MQAQVLSSENIFILCADVVQTAEGNIVRAFDGKHETSTAESKTWCMYGNSKRENREIPSAPRLRSRGRLVNLTEGTANMHADGKSQTRSNGRQPRAIVSTVMLSLSFD